MRHTFDSALRTLLLTGTIVAATVQGAPGIASAKGGHPVNHNRDGKTGQVHAAGRVRGSAKDASGDRASDRSHAGRSRHSDGRRGAGPQQPGKHASREGGAGPGTAAAGQRGGTHGSPNHRGSGHHGDGHTARDDRAAGSGAAAGGEQPAGKHSANGPDAPKSASARSVTVETAVSAPEAPDALDGPAPTPAADAGQDTIGSPAPVQTNQTPAPVAVPTPEESVTADPAATEESPVVPDGAATDALSASGNVPGGSGGSNERDHDGGGARGQDGDRPDGRAAQEAGSGDRPASDAGSEPVTGRRDDRQDPSVESVTADAATVTPDADAVSAPGGAAAPPAGEGGESGRTQDPTAADARQDAPDAPPDSASSARAPRPERDGGDASVAAAAPEHTVETTRETPTLVPPAGAERTRVRLRAATHGWQGTGVRLRPGDRVAIRATGSVTYCREGWCAGTEIGPDGGAAECPDYGCGAVLGQYGRGNVFLAGRGIEFVADNDGELRLQVFDNPTTYGDNHGFFEVTIEVTR